MKIILTIFLVFSLNFASDFEVEIPSEFDKNQYKTGEEIFDNKCSSCHVKYMNINKVVRNFFHENNKMNLKAPTANQISFRLKQQIGDKNDIEFHLYETKDFLENYIFEPDKSKSICLKAVIDYFDGMPTMKDKVLEDEIEQINHFLYFLEGFNGINEYFHDETKF